MKNQEKDLLPIIKVKQVQMLNRINAPVRVGKNADQPAFNATIFGTTTDTLPPTLTGF